MDIHASLIAPTEGWMRFEPAAQPPNSSLSNSSVPIFHILTEENGATEKEKKRTEEDSVARLRLHSKELYSKL